MNAGAGIRTQEPTKGVGLEPTAFGHFATPAEYEK